MSKRGRLRLDPSERRLQIVDAALHLIGERGYRGFTVQAIAQACNISNAGLLHYFGSKDALLLGVIEEIARREAETISPLLAACVEEPGPESLSAALRGMVASAMGKPEVTRFLVTLMTESISQDHPAHDWFRRREHETRDLLVRMASDWCIDPDSLALQIQVMLTGFTQQWLRDECKFDLIAEWDKALTAILRDQLAPA